jgi:predicted alpha/beta hydrolase family esterase
MDMKNEMLFIEGGGNNGYEADIKLVNILRRALGDDCEINYPLMKTDQAAPDFGWPEQIGKEISELNGHAILAAHSLGASMLLKYLSENSVKKNIAGVFLLATPFWNGEEDWKQGLKLREDFAERLPKNSRIFFYHCHDDEEVPFIQLSSYRQKLPAATFREVESGGHQFANDLNLVANDIKSVMQLNRDSC